MKRAHHIKVLFFIHGCLPASCTLPTEKTTPPTSLAEKSILLAEKIQPTIPPVAYSPSDHRTGVRMVGRTGEFYDRLTGEKFARRDLGLETGALIQGKYR
jgi:hypothetical protein